MLTREKIKRFIRDAVRTLSREARTHEDYLDGAFSKTDEWWEEEIGTGRIDELPDAPEDNQDIDWLNDAALILKTAVEENWGVADDPGLWEGLAPFPAIMSQAFFTLEGAISQQEPEELMNPDDEEEDDDEEEEEENPEKAEVER